MPFTRAESFLLRHPNFAWLVLSWNLKMTDEILEKYAEFFYWFHVLHNKSINPDVHLIEKYLEHIPFGCKTRENPNCIEFVEREMWTLELIKKYEGIWEWEALEQNEFVTANNEIMTKYGTLLGAKEQENNAIAFEHPLTIKWNRMERAVKNAKTWEDINAIPDLDWYHVSIAEHLPWSESKIEEHVEKWDWKALAHNYAIPWSLELVRRYEDRWDWWVDKVDYSAISLNQAIPWTIPMIDRYKDKIQFEMLQLSPAVNWSIDMLESFEDVWNLNNAACNAALWDKVFEGQLTSLDLLLEELAKLGFGDGESY